MGGGKELQILVLFVSWDGGCLRCQIRDSGMSFKVIPRSQIAVTGGTVVLTRLDSCSLLGSAEKADSHSKRVSASGRCSEIINFFTSSFSFLIHTLSFKLERYRYRKKALVEATLQRQLSTCHAVFPLDTMLV